MSNGLDEALAVIDHMCSDPECDAEFDPYAETSGEV
jgi:hypothetical protein